MKRVVVVALAALLLSACALLPYRPSPPAAGLLDVRFWPQQAYQCGPAALAMALNASAVEVTPQALVDVVYLPARHGSLQAEMLAAPRRYERIAYRVPTRFSALETMLQARLPVVVLLNLGTRWWPVWHYAVVIGADQHSVWLHSGQQAQRAMPRAAFERHWRAARNWAMVVVEPQQLPPGLDAEQLAHTLAAIEQTFPELARRAYSAALQRWPEQLVLRFGLANTHMALQQWREAQTVLREMHARHPRSPPIANNLALVYQQLNQPDLALEVLRPILAELPPESDWRGVLERTWYDVQRVRPGAS